jgi:hypothetical protein
MLSADTPHPRRNIVVWRTSMIIGVTLILLLLLTQRLSARPNDIDLIHLSVASIVELPEVYIEWETGREVNVAGFYVGRALSATLPYTRVSAFIPAEGSPAAGALYDIVDETSELGKVYYYRLEVVNSDQGLTMVGPISITAGVDSISRLIIPRVYLPLVSRTLD